MTERLTADDLLAWAGDRGTPPLRIGAVLVLGPVDGAGAELESCLRGRLGALPRLRQRPARRGWGRAVWVDRPGFRVEDHVGVTPCPAPYDEDAVLGVAARLATAPWPAGGPLWAVRLVTGLTGGRAAVVIVAAHVLADGLGGLALLTRLVDGAVTTATPPSPPPRLPVTAGAGPLRFMRRGTAAAARLAAALSALAPLLGTRAARSVLNRPAGPRRQFLVARAALPELHTLAREHGVTVNDVLLAAVAGALGRVLARRGSPLAELRVSMPVSSRTPGEVAEPRNAGGVVPVIVPTGGDLTARLAAVGAATRRAKAYRRGVSTALIGPWFRALAAVGLYQRFLDRQRLVHTFVSDLRGPAAIVRIAGVPVSTIIPLSSAPGNVSLSFTAVSYRDTLAVTVSADPDGVLDPDQVRDALQAELAAPTGRDQRPDIHR